MLSKSELTDREQFIVHAKESGVTCAEIARILHISKARPYQIYKKYKNRIDDTSWQKGLSVRICNCLNNVGIHSREQALKAFQSGHLTPGPQAPRNYGWKSHKELAAWLGLPEPCNPKKP